MLGILKRHSIQVIIFNSLPGKFASLWEYNGASRQAIKRYYYLAQWKFHSQQASPVPTCLCIFLYLLETQVFLSAKYQEERGHERLKELAESTEGLYMIFLLDYLKSNFPYFAKVHIGRYLISDRFMVNSMTFSQPRVPNKPYFTLITFRFYSSFIV